jgi:hypothetical protein
MMASQFIRIALWRIWKNYKNDRCDHEEIEERKWNLKLKRSKR